jgi:hypothetical protein
MNDAESDGATADVEPPSSGEPQPRPPTLLIAAPSLALAALVAAPLTVAVRIASHFADPQTAALVADDCRNAFTNSAFHTLKWPLCGGD